MFSNIIENFKIGLAGPDIRHSDINSKPDIWYPTFLKTGYPENPPDTEDYRRNDHPLILFYTYPFKIFHSIL